ncbi:MAG: beta galactosidase jelly roll domain-containing protein [Thermoprotei archaeon]|nr:beta galactosidase jelly roll domain-containing protein [Thermoprotei archaeon]
MHGEEVLILLSLLLLSYISTLNLVTTSSNQNPSQYPSPTFELRRIKDVLVPFQNGLPYPSFEPSCSRLTYSLNGEWRIYYDVNSRFNTLTPRTPENIKRLESELARLPPFKSWEKTHVPSCNNVRGSKHEGYQGVTWYVKFFVAPKTFQGKFVRLIFQGVNYFADVWLNGHYLGYHEGGFTPFIFNVTNLLNYGSNNTLIVRVDNIPWESTKAIVPYKVCDWWNYGGIYRDVYLEALSPVYIARADVIPFKNNDLWNLNLTLVLHNTQKQRVNANISVSVYPVGVLKDEISKRFLEEVVSLKGEPLIATNLTITISPRSVEVIRVPFKGLKVMEWTPETPYLYVLHVSLKSPLGADELNVQFGFREVKVSDGQLLLNGKHLFLKGLNRHEDYPGKGRALDFEDILRDLKFIKDMRANWVRTAHYPNHPMTYVLADRLGLLIWEEIPVYWFDGEAFKIQMSRGIAKQMLLEMVFRDYNRPSIIIWSLANECGSYEERIEYLKEQAYLARLVDPTRLLAEAIVWNPNDDTWLKAGLDLLAVNAYFGVFYGNVKDLGPNLDKLHSKYPEVPILITEFGLWSGGGVGEERQADYFRKTWSQLKQRGYLAGVCWWAAFDYDSMRVFDTFGAISWDRTHKKALFYEIKKAYEEFQLPEKSKRGTLLSIPLLLLVAILLPLLCFIYIYYYFFRSRDTNSTNSSSCNDCRNPS